MAVQSKLWDSSFSQISFKVSLAAMHALQLLSATLIGFKMNLVRILKVINIAFCHVVLFDFS